jgi:hypothetical protein
MEELYRKNGAVAACGMRCQQAEVEERLSVRFLAQRFASATVNERERAGKWGRARRQGRYEEPARAKVLGLRKFWERVGENSIAP